MTSKLQIHSSTLASMFLGIVRQGGIVYNQPFLLIRVEGNPTSVLGSQSTDTLACSPDTVAIIQKPHEAGPNQEMKGKLREEKNAVYL